MSLKTLVKRAVPAPLWSRLRRLRSRVDMWRYLRAIERYPARTVRELYDGVPLTVSIGDAVAEEWYGRGWPALPELEIHRRRKLRPGARVFDLGAHQGVLALLLAKAVGPAGRVLALEVNAHNAAVAARNRDLNDVGPPQLEILNAAVGESTGTLVFNQSLNSRAIADGNGNEAFGRVEVAAFSVDDLAERHGMPDLVVLDVEGFEGRVLRGAKQALSAGPDWLVEVHVGVGLEFFGDTAESVLAFFDPNIYELFLAAANSSDGGGGAGAAFEPYHPGHPAAAARFFLAALRRPSGHD